ncbi:MAG: SPOR domain-containing protein [Gammaproteobacteria bacterium]|nr:SPOR domain-containing protein [Gammaproteobacteria bacterium]MDH3413892.1 SPOR domain-containing protein [Gammaproteobacteria bacterium]
MNKSQLRKLAREYSLGNLEEGEYLHRRRNLVDDIVSGKVAIIREVPPPPRQAYSEDPTTKVSIGSRNRAQRLLPAVLFMVVVVLAGVIWVLISPGPGEPVPVAGVDQAAHAPAASRARLLIDEFVDQQDFSAFSIASFKESWSHLTYAEKREAYAAHWLNDLINLINDEIKAQNALLGADESGNAAETGRRLIQFASFLGISEYVTEFKGALEQPASAAASTVIEQGADSAPELDESAQASAPIEAPVPSPEPITAIPDTEWLAAQPDDAYTLQLFAVNHLDEIHNLIGAHPGVDLQVLVSAQSEPRYRVMYGAFDSEDAAHNAYAELPADIRQAQPVALVKSLSSLREEIGRDGLTVGQNASKYTLQVFSTDNVVSAQRLQADYPALGLNLLETTNPYSRYRVLYGVFDSEDMAKEAAGSLPPELLRDVGDPLIKSVSELQPLKP